MIRCIVKDVIVLAVFCWDFDGTLTWCDHLWSGSVQKALLETVPDAKIEFNAIRKCNETGFSWHTPEKAYPDRTGELWWEDMNRHFYKSCLSLGLNEEQSRTAAEKVRAIIKKKENYFLFDGVYETLEHIKNQGHKNILLSNNYPDLKEVTDALDLTQYFEHMVISGLVGYEKPHPKLFEMAKALYPNESDFYMVGDNINADIIGGKNAGMKTILVHKGFDERADYCFDKLKNIKNIF